MTTDISTSLATFGLISDANRKALDDWFSEMFVEIRAGGGGNLLSESVVGRTFTFGEGVTIQQAFNGCAQAISYLDGRIARKTVARFS